MHGFMGRAYAQIRLNFVIHFLVPELFSELPPSWSHSFWTDRGNRHNTQKSLTLVPLR